LGPHGSFPSTYGDEVLPASITNMLFKYFIWPQLMLNIFLRRSGPNVFVLKHMLTITYDNIAL
jgi:hypothetical protein